MKNYYYYLQPTKFQESLINYKEFFFSKTISNEFNFQLIFTFLIIYCLFVHFKKIKSKFYLELAPRNR